MALTLRFTFGVPCAANNHVPATAILTPGGSRTYPVTRSALVEPVTEDEREAAARVILRLLVAQLPGSTLAQMKTAIEAKTIDFTVTV